MTQNIKLTINAALFEPIFRLPPTWRGIAVIVTPILAILGLIASRVRHTNPPLRVTFTTKPFNQRRLSSRMKKFPENSIARQAYATVIPLCSTPPQGPHFLKSEPRNPNIPYLATLFENKKKALSQAVLSHPSNENPWQNRTLQNQGLELMQIAYVLGTTTLRDVVRLSKRSQHSNQEILLDPECYALEVLTRCCTLYHTLRSAAYFDGTFPKKEPPANYFHAFYHPPDRSTLGHIQSLYHGLLDNLHALTFDLAELPDCRLFKYDTHNSPPYEEYPSPFLEKGRGLKIWMHSYRRS